MSSTKKQILALVIGPIFDTPHGSSGQGGALHDRLLQTGYRLYKASHYKNKVKRFLHTIYVLILHASNSQIILLQSFGLLAFVMEDTISFLARTLRIPVVFTLRGGAFYEFFQKHPHWVRRVLRRATAITSPSLFLKEKFEQHGFQVQHIPNAIQLERFPFRRAVEKRHSLLWVRAFNDIYHPELAIETIAALKPRHPDVHLTMIGPDQGTLAACRSRIQELGLEDHISMLGYVANTELSRYYSTHAVYLNTTRYESFGVALVEAGACGIPCVSTSVGEIPYIWQDGVNIFLAERSSEAFAAKVAALFEDQDLADRISQAARENARQYDWATVLPQWEALIDTYAKK